MRIGQLAAQAGVSVRALRYYEEQGLLTSSRSPSGQRLYDDDAADRVELIRSFFAAGLPSRVIVDILPCVDQPSVEHTDQAWEHMARERDRLDVTLAELTRTREVLDDMLACHARHRRDTAAQVTASG